MPTGSQLPRHGSIAAVTAAWTRGHAWAHRGRIRAAVAKVVFSVVGFAVIAAGVAMLVLPGPGLVVIVLGLAVLAAEWDWAKVLLRKARARVEVARAAALPRNASLGRRVAVGASALAMGAASWAFSVALMGGPPTVVVQAWTTVAGLVR
jgi:uncharacterized protein (TIGR02611 family)